MVEKLLFWGTDGKFCLMKVLEDDLLLVDFGHGDFLVFLFDISYLAFLLILKTGRRRLFDGEVSDDGFVSLGFDFAVL